MKTLGDIRASGIITIYGGSQYQAERLDLCQLAQQVKHRDVYMHPIPVVDDEKTGCGSIFIHRDYPDVPRLVMVLNQEEYHIRTDCFALMMSEGQQAAQILAAREEVLPKGQCTLAGVLA